MFTFQKPMAPWGVRPRCWCPAWSPPRPDRRSAPTLWRRSTTRSPRPPGTGHRRHRRSMDVFWGTKKWWKMCVLTPKNGGRGRFQYVFLYVFKGNTDELWWIMDVDPHISQPKYGIYYSFFVLLWTCGWWSLWSLMLLLLLGELTKEVIQLLGDINRLWSPVNSLTMVHLSASCQWDW